MSLAAVTVAQAVLLRERLVSRRDTDYIPVIVSLSIGVAAWTRYENAAWDASCRSLYKAMGRGLSTEVYT